MPDAMRIMGESSYLGVLAPKSDTLPAGRREKTLQAENRKYEASFEYVSHRYCGGISLQVRYYYGVEVCSMCISFASSELICRPTRI